MKPRWPHCFGCSSTECISTFVLCYNSFLTTWGLVGPNVVQVQLNDFSYSVILYFIDIKGYPCVRVSAHPHFIDAAHTGPPDVSQHNFPQNYNFWKPFMSRCAAGLFQFLDFSCVDQGEILDLCVGVCEWGCECVWDWHSIPYTSLGHFIIVWVHW